MQSIIYNEINNLENRIYGSFGIRFKAVLIDAIIFLPILGIYHYLNSISLLANGISYLFLILFNIVYSIYFPYKYGGTPGKLISGLKIQTLYGNAIGIKESILRYSINIVFLIFGGIIHFKSLFQANELVYQKLSWLKKGIYLQEFNQTIADIQSYLYMFVLLIDNFTLLFNKKYRAIHDYLANTVVVKS